MNFHFKVTSNPIKRRWLLVCLLGGLLASGLLFASRRDSSPDISGQWGSDGDFSYFSFTNGTVMVSGWEKKPKNGKVFGPSYLMYTKCYWSKGNQLNFKEQLPHLGKGPVSVEVKDNSIRFTTDKGRSYTFTRVETTEPLFIIE